MNSRSYRYEPMRFNFARPPTTTATTNGGGRAASFTNAIAHLWLTDVLADHQYRTRVLGEGRRSWRPAQALIVAILEDVIKEVEYGDEEAANWLRGTYDKDLIAEGKFTLNDVVAYLGITAPLDYVQKTLLARIGIKAGTHKTPAWRRSHRQPRQTRPIFNGFHQERWRMRK